jgi:hypothetical protein
MYAAELRGCRLGAELRTRGGFLNVELTVTGELWV